MDTKETAVRNFIGLAGLFLMAFALGGCGDTGDANTLYVAVACPITGQGADFGKTIKGGVKLAVKEINDAGGIGGRKIKIIWKDDEGTEKAAGNVARQIAAMDKVLAIVGHFNSSCSLTGKPIYKEAGIPAMSPGSTNPNVCKGSDWYFRNIFTDTMQGQQLARYCKNQLKSKKVAVFYDNDDYGKGLRDTFMGPAKKIGLLVKDYSFTRDDRDFRPLIRKAMAEGIDTIFISGLYHQGGQIGQQAREVGFRGAMLGADGLRNEGLIKAGGEGVEGMYVSDPFLLGTLGQEGRKWVQAYRALHNNEPDAWAAFSYDAMKMIAVAIEKGGATREGIRDYLASITDPDKAFKGITGLTYFDENGDCISKSTSMAIVKNGKFVPAEKQPAASE